MCAVFFLPLTPFTFLSRTDLDLIKSSLAIVEHAIDRGMLAITILIILINIATTIVSSLPCVFISRRTKKRIVKM
jgi:hypothetical protein